MLEKRLDYNVGFLSILTGLLVGVVVSVFRPAIPIMLGFIEALILFGQNSWLHSILFIFMFSIIGFIVA